MNGRTLTLTLVIPNTVPPNEPDGWQRLRRVLKALLRSYGLRCINIREDKEAQHEA